MNNSCPYDQNCKCDDTPQTHVHEVTGSVHLPEPGVEAHNHRFAGVTGEVVVVPGGHIHVLRARTDFYEAHYHFICVKTGLQVIVGEGEDARHVHFIDCQTSFDANHLHEFIAATLIENPIGD